MKIYKVKPKTQHLYNRAQYICAQYKCVLGDAVVYVDDDYSLLRIHVREEQTVAYMAHMKKTYDELSSDDPEYKMISMLLI